jgi:hypothetical protein
MRVTRQWELFRNRNFSGMGVIRQQKLSGNQSYPAVLTKRLQRRIKNKPVERFRLWSAGLRQTDSQADLQKDERTI